MATRDSYAAGTPSWVDVSVDDVGAALDAVTAAGGQVVAGPMDVPDGKGTFGLFADPNGAFCGLWKAGTHIGAERVNEPGSFVWNELATPDAPSSVAFYSAVFGWGESSGNEAGAVFTDPDGRPICGAHTAGDGEPPFWSVWFAVDDCDATVARVQELGGSVLVAPNDMGFGRGAVVAAPGGAVFGVGDMNQLDD